MIRLMDSAFTVILMEHATKATGKKINNMVRAWRPGQMVQATKAIMLKDVRMERAASPGQIRAHTLETSLRTTLRATVSRSTSQVF